MFLRLAVAQLHERVGGVLEQLKVHPVDVVVEVLEHLARHRGEELPADLLPVAGTAPRPVSVLHVRVIRHARTMHHVGLEERKSPTSDIL